ncbi:MAG: hypothetical protein GY803_28130 [Chloroflexi bacterium]|nr:hypothetical protein [Chloroflexota bacterium]
MKTLSQSTQFEYRSKEEINGWPIIHINLGANPETDRPLVAKGVVAIGNIAIGVVSIGAAAFGVVTLAGFGLGIVSLAGLAIGIIALGAVALGYEYALGAAVLSSKFANGAFGLDFQFVMWTVIFATSIALVAWRMGKVKANRQQG